MKLRWALFLGFILISLHLSGQVSIVTPAQSAPTPEVTPVAGKSGNLRTGPFLAIFGGKRLSLKHRNQNINYDLDPSLEKFFVYVPETYTGETPFGLVVFVHPGNDIEGIPEGWKSVLEARKLLFVAAEGSGNNVESSRRMGLSVLGALKMMKHYRVDPQRVYSSGFSGGARIACQLGFFQPDVFRGTIQNSGADFYKPVAKVLGTSESDGDPYGVFNATSAEVEAAKHVRFVLIVGSNDPRHGDILDIYNGGFASSGLHSKLIDVPGLGHDVCDGTTLSAALDFIEGK